MTSEGRCRGACRLLLAAGTCFFLLASLGLLHAEYNRNKPGAKPAPAGKTIQRYSGLGADRPEEFDEVLAATADRTHRDVILLLFDLGFLDMTINFLETSLLPHNIHNALLISTDRRACDVITGLYPDLICFIYRADRASSKASTYDTPDFIRKMNIRTEFILDALLLGYHVLHSDVDAVFLSNPLPWLRKCRSCHVQVLWDSVRYGPGFVYVRSSNESRKFYQLMAEIPRKDPKIVDQTAFNRAASRMRNTLMLQILDKRKFPSGKAYFEDTRRMFWNEHPTSDVIAIQNNWIVSKEAKVYRFKEHLMWKVDFDGYYSSPYQKYMTYDNPLPASRQVSLKQIQKLEIEALISALAIGRILNRTVILPRFHCDHGQCPLNSLLHLPSFDLEFQGQYRENSFLDNPLTAKNIRRIVNHTLLLYNEATRKHFPASKLTGKETIFTPNLNKHGASSRDIIQWLGSWTDHVIKFHSLYNAFTSHVRPRDERDFRLRVSRGVKKSQYRQYSKQSFL